MVSEEFLRKMVMKRTLIHRMKNRKMIFLRHIMRKDVFEIFTLIGDFKRRRKWRVTLLRNYNRVVNARDNR